MINLLIDQALALGLSIGVIALLLVVFFVTAVLLYKKGGAKGTSICEGCTLPCTKKGDSTKEGCKE